MTAGFTRGGVPSRDNIGRGSVKKLLKFFRILPHFPHSQLKPADGNGFA